MGLKQRYTVLDLARIIAIALVVLRHIGTTMLQRAGAPERGLFGMFGVPGFYYVSLGGIGVVIFLLLSGLSLQLNCEGDPPSWGRFMVRRCVRIYPIYYMSLVIGAFAYYWRVGSLPRFDAVDYLCAITGFYAFAGRWGGPLVATAWFIGLIMGLYVLFPVIARCMKAHPHTTVLALLATSVGARLIVGRSGILPYEPLRWFPLCNLFEFGLGMYLATVVRRGFWERLNGPAWLNSLTGLLSNLSFPLFLIHLPLLIVLESLLAHGMSAEWAIGIYLAVSIGTSTVLCAIDRRLSGWLRVALRS